jgi:hypothetical protein
LTGGSSPTIVASATAPWIRERNRPPAVRWVTCTYRRRFLARRAGLGEAGRTGVADAGWVE